eukprot:scpid112244/ scgid28776/ 
MHTAKTVTEPCSELNLLRILITHTHLTVSVSPPTFRVHIHGVKPPHCMYITSAKQAQGLYESVGWFLEVSSVSVIIVLSVALSDSPVSSLELLLKLQYCRAPRTDRLESHQAQ